MIHGPDRYTLSHWHGFSRASWTFRSHSVGKCRTFSGDKARVSPGVKTWTKAMALFHNTNWPLMGRAQIVKCRLATVTFIHCSRLITFPFVCKNPGTITWQLRCRKTVTNQVQSEKESRRYPVGIVVGWRRNHSKNGLEFARMSSATQLDRYKLLILGSKSLSDGGFIDLPIYWKWRTYGNHPHP